MGERCSRLSEEQVQRPRSKEILGELEEKREDREAGAQGKDEKRLKRQPGARHVGP